MSILKNLESSIKYDFSIIGLGYEERSTNVFSNQRVSEKNCLVLGYSYYTDKFYYQSNKDKFNGCMIKELDDANVEEEVVKFVREKTEGKQEVNVLIDVTVMTRHRLAVVLWTCLNLLPKGSIVRVSYSLSDFVAPPKDMSPVKEMGPIIDPLGGVPSNVGFPTSLVVSLGYEENKALGAANYIDANEVVAFIPKGEVLEFNGEVIRSNRDFLRSVSDKNRFTYDLHSPYKSYGELKSVALSLMKESRPIILPLGPKIIAALAVILGIELYPHLPIWRLSSKGAEEPVNRKASEHIVFFDYKV